MLHDALAGMALGLHATAARDENIDYLVTRGGLERRERRAPRAGVDGHSQQSAATRLPEVWRAVQFAPQHLLAYA